MDKSLSRKGVRFRPPAQGRPHSCRQFCRRERLDDVIGGSGVQRPGDRLVPAVAGDEHDRQIGQFGNTLHQLDAIGSGQHQIQQDQLGFVRLDESGHLLGVARHQHVVAVRIESIPNVPQRLRVVVDHQDARRLLPFPRPVGTARGVCGRGAACGLFGHRNRKAEPRAAALPRRSRPRCGPRAPRPAPSRWTAPGRLPGPPPGGLRRLRRRACGTGAEAVQGVPLCPRRIPKSQR